MKNDKERAAKVCQAKAVGGIAIIALSPIHIQIKPH